METLTRPIAEKFHRPKEISAEEQCLADFLRSYGIIVKQQYPLTVKLHNYRLDYLLTSPHYPSDPNLPRVKLLVEFLGSWHYKVSADPVEQKQNQDQANKDRTRLEILNRFLASTAQSIYDPQEIIITDCLRPNTENLAIILDAFEQRCPLATQERIDKVKANWKQRGKIKEYHLKKLQNLKNLKLAV